jgi:hypothetical protein
MTAQQTLPFTRDEQAAAIDAALERLRPALSASKLRGLRALLGAVLTLPRNERGELPLDLLAARLDVTERTARTHLQAAEALALVVVDRADGMRRPHCIRLDFDGLRRAARVGLATGRPAPPSVDPVAVASAQIPVACENREPSPRVAPSCPTVAHVRKNFPNDRKNFPIGEATGHDVCLYLDSPPYSPPKAETGAEWEAAAAELRRIGFGGARAAIAEARALGRSAADVVAAVAVFEANRDRLASPGALRFWIRENAWPVDGVGPGGRGDEKRRRDDANARRLAGYAAQAAAAADENAALERDHGPTLDALGDREREALVAATLRDRATLDAYRRGRWRESGSLVRLALLSAIAEAAVATVSN